MVLLSVVGEDECCSSNDIEQQQICAKASHESVYDLSLRISQAALTLIYAVSPCVVLESDSESLQGVRLTTWMMIYGSERAATGSR